MKKYQPSPKLQFAMNYLTDHPAQMFATGRVLEKRVQVSQWQSISYRTWNDAKRLLNTPTFNDLDVIEPRRVVILNFNELTITYQGRKSRCVRKRSHDAMQRTLNLCCKEDYRLTSPIKGVYILVKDFDVPESEAA